MGRPRIFTPEQVAKAVELRRQGKSLNETAKIVAGNSGGGTRESLRRSLRAYGFIDNPPLRLIYQPRDFSHIDQWWWAEFRGFFWGEGSIILAKSNHSGFNLQPQMKISLRDDDAAVLHDIHEKLGGSLATYTRKIRENQATYGKRIINPQLAWAVVGIPNIYGILPYLEQGVLPSKKKAELATMREFCEYRLELPLKLTPEQKVVLNTFYEKLRALKRYNPNC